MTQRIIESVTTICELPSFVADRYQVHGAVGIACYKAPFDTTRTKGYARLSDFAHRPPFARRSLAGMRVWIPSIPPFAFRHPDEFNMALEIECLKSRVAFLRAYDTLQYWVVTQRARGIPFFPAQKHLDAAHFKEWVCNKERIRKLHMDMIDEMELIPLKREIFSLEKKLHKEIMTLCSISQRARQHA